MEQIHLGERVLCLKNTSNKNRANIGMKTEGPEESLVFVFTHLWFNICIVVVLQQQSRSLCVILAGGDVQSRQPNFALGIVLQQQWDNLVMALLEGHCQRGEAILNYTTETSLRLVAQILIRNARNSRSLMTGSNPSSPSSLAAHWPHVHVS